MSLLKLTSGSAAGSPASRAKVISSGRNIIWNNSAQFVHPAGIIGFRQGV